MLFTKTFGGAVRTVLRLPVVQWFAAFLVASAPALQAQNTPPTYAGRPFIRIAQANSSDPVAGFYGGFGRAQVVGNSVVFVTLSGPNASGIFRGRGGPFEKVASAGSSISGVTLLAFHDGFARDSGSGMIAIAAGSDRPDALQLTDGISLTTLLASGTVLPNSGGKPANVIGEPFYAGGETAVIAWHAPASGGVDFRGVYRVKNGALETVADTATALPGAVAVPDGFSSQVGFDGGTLAFWASRGPFAQTEGMFLQAAGGAVVKIAESGESLPGGGTIDGFVSPPFVSNGIVYFYAFDTASQTRLLKYESGALSVLAQDGAAAPEGGTLRNLGQFGLAAENGKVFFPALTERGAGVYVIDGGTLQTIVPSGSAVGGITPASIVLQDVADDTLVLDASTFSVRRLLANLAAPAVPVIVSDLTNKTVPDASRLELKVEVIGDGPLTYAWFANGVAATNVTSNTFVLENAGALDTGSYRVTVSNAAGSVNSATAFVNVEAAPVLIANPTNTVVEAGDSLAVRVAANGGSPLSYFWRKDGAAVTSDSPALGLFFRTSAKESDAGRYSVIISNAFGTITSAEVTVTVNPASPNPVFGGGRFVSILDDATVAPGTELKFNLETLSEYSARWVGERPVFTAQSTTGAELGVFAWENNALVTLLAPDAPLGNGLGNADGFMLAFALPNEPLMVRAQQMVSGFRQPVGLYAFTPPNLEVIADVSLDAPDANGAKFPIFYGDAFRAAGKTVFLSTPGDVPSVYIHENGQLRRILHAKQDLPGNGTATTQFQSLAYNGSDILVVAATASQQKLVALRINAAGEVSKLLAKDEAFPGGGADVVRSFGPSGTDGDAFYLKLYDGGFKPNVFSWKDGVFTRLAGPGMQVGTLGTIQSVDSSFPKASNGKAYMSVRVSTPNGAVNGIVAASPGGIEPVLFASKLDARRITASYLVDVSGEKVLAMVTHSDGTRALYANIGSVDEEPTLRLDYTRADASTLRFAVPGGAQLEAAAEVSGPWEQAAGTEATITSGSRYFRLRRP